ncbi:hypothetical protein [Chromohalobacter sp.]|uniref:hypothetical protein n=1 Tax=Chromohalobacter sp. TaxID=50740 RepID=UPI00324220C7
MALSTILLFMPASFALNMEPGLNKLLWIAIGTYAVFGKVLRHWFSRPAMRQLFNRICAGFLGSAGIGLLLARRA